MWDLVVQYTPSILSSLNTPHHIPGSPPCPPTFPASPWPPRSEPLTLVPDQVPLACQEASPFPQRRLSPFSTVTVGTVYVGQFAGVKIDTVFGRVGVTASF